MFAYLCHSLSVILEAVHCAETPTNLYQIKWHNLRNGSSCQTSTNHSEYCLLLPFFFLDYSLTMKMKAVPYSDTSVSLFQNRRRHIADGSICHLTTQTSEFCSDLAGHLLGLIFAVKMRQCMGDPVPGYTLSHVTIFWSKS